MVPEVLQKVDGGLKPLVGIFYNFHRVRGCFARGYKGFGALPTKGSGRRPYPFTLGATLYLIQQAANIPYYIQLLAAEVWQSVITTRSDVTTDMIDSAVERIVTLKGDYYQELFDRQSVMQKKLLMALVSSGDNIFSTAYTKQYRLTAASTTQKSVLSLQENGLVDKINNTWFVCDPFFKRYLQNYAL